MRIAERVPRNINVNEFKNFKEKIARANKKKAFKKISARPSINRPKNVEFLLNLATPPSEKSNTRYTKYKIIPKSKNFSEPVIINKPIRTDIEKFRKVNKFGLKFKIIKKVVKIYDALQQITCEKDSFVKL